MAKADGKSSKSIGDSSQDAALPPSRRSTSSGSRPGWAATAIGLDHRRHPAQHRRRRDGGDPRPAQSPPAQPRAGLRGRRRVHEVLVHGRTRANSTRSCWCWKGSVPNEKIKEEGYWAAMGTNAETGQPITTSEWIDRLAPKAMAVVAAGTCATYGGIHAMEGNPTGAMGLADYLGWDWKSKAGLPIVNVPGCPVQPDNFMETLLYLLYQVAGLAPMIPLDDQLRPKWLFEHDRTRGVRPRRLSTNKGNSPRSTARPECLVKLGCWGPVVNCNVTKRGWMAGIGGCPNVGGICIGCTMPGFPDKFMPFMDEPPGARLSTLSSSMYGRAITRSARITNHTVNKEPKWRHTGSALTTGYAPLLTAFTPQVGQVLTRWPTI